MALIASIPQPRAIVDASATTIVESAEMRSRSTELFRAEEVDKRAAQLEELANAIGTVRSRNESIYQIKHAVGVNGELLCPVDHWVDLGINIAVTVSAGPSLVILCLKFPQVPINVRMHFNCKESTERLSVHTCAWRRLYQVGPDYNSHNLCIHLRPRVSLDSSRSPELWSSASTSILYTPNLDPSPWNCR